MRLRRAIFTNAPLDGDYILTSSGYSWNLRRSDGDGSAQSVADGERGKAVAMAQLSSLAAAARTDAWERIGTGEFSLLRRFRTSFAVKGPR
jgi:hypothetical protein